MFWRARRACRRSRWAMRMHSTSNHEPLVTHQQHSSTHSTRRMTKRGLPGCLMSLRASVPRIPIPGSARRCPAFVRLADSPHHEVFTELGHAGNSLNCTLNAILAVRGGVG